MKSDYLKILVALLLFLVISTGAASAAGSISIGSADNVKVSETITLPVNITGNDNITTFQISVWNNVSGASIKVNKTETPFGSGYNFPKDVSAEIQTVGWMNTDGVLAEGVLFYVDITPSEEGEGMDIPLALTVEALAKFPAIPVMSEYSVSSGLVTVGSRPIIENLSVVPKASSAKITFDISKAVPENVEVRLNSSGDPIVPTETEPGKYEAEISGLTFGKDYDVTVSAENEFGSNEESEPFTTLIPTRIEVTGDIPEPRILVGMSGSLTATVYDEDESPIEGEEVTWMSNDTGVISFDEGVYTAHKKGTATLSVVSVTNPACNETIAEVEVFTAPSVMIQDPEDGSNHLGEVSFNASWSDFASDPEISWNFGDETGSDTRASVSYAYTASGSYTVTVTATGTDILGVAAAPSVSIVVNIVSTPTSLIITDLPVEGEIPFNSTGTLNASVYDQFKSEVTDPELVWKSDNSSITIDPATGFYTGVAEGTANITASVKGYPDVKNVTTIKVKPEIMVPTSVKISEPVFGKQYTISETGNLKAVVLDQHQGEMPNEIIIWTSANSSILSVSGTTATANAAGNVVLTATCDNNTQVFSNVTVTVLPDPVKPTLPIASGDIQIDNGTTIVSNIVNDSTKGMKVEGNQLVLTDLKTGVVVTTTFKDMKYDEDNETVSGNISTVKAVYPSMILTPDVNYSTNCKVDVEITFGNQLTDLPEFLPAISPASKSTILGSQPEGVTYDVGFMLQEISQGSFSNMPVTLTFEVPKEWIEDPAYPEIWGMHVKGSTVDKFAVTCVPSGDVYKVTIRSNAGFSDYGLVRSSSSPGPVPPAPSYSGDNGGADDGAELLASVGASATAKPTTAPTTKPVTEPTVPATVAPTSDDSGATPVPTESGAIPTTAPPATTQGPVPLFGILAGLGAAAVLGRKYR